MTASVFPVPPGHVESLRRFNRLYTRRIGVLDPYLGSELSLTEVRVLYELAHRDQPTARELGLDLGLDPGYLSRILRRFESKGWVGRVASPADRRQNLLALTAAGRRQFKPLEQRSRDEATALLAVLAPADQARLVQALGQVGQLLDPQAETRVRPTVLLREPKAGDLGWVVQAHGEIYAGEYGLNAEFEGLVAGIVAHYVKHFDAAHERCWIAEVDGQRAGSVFVVRKSASVAQLRMLILTPQGRGLGLGARLTDEAIGFARARGYRRMRLWTQSNLLEARQIYQRRGFRLVRSEPNQAFGVDLVSETWELELGPARPVSRKSSLSSG
jgi:DNA-binding MarR family transcriptional regulator/GNAT superfamily N-acetyltransferase